MKGARLSLRRVFAGPIALAVATLAGLVAALTGDGWRDGLSWVALAAPIAVTGWVLFTRRH